MAIRTWLENTFIEIFGTADEEIHFFYAPGRLNLLGDHTDYNGGYVLPMALDMGTYLVLRRNARQTYSFASTNKAGRFDIPVLVDPTPQQGDWINYPLGVLHHLKLAGASFLGYDMLYHSDLPLEAGLASSAAIEVVTAVAMNDLYDLQLEKKDIALLCHKAENEFAGMPCGIMDSFAIALHRKNTALFLNCATQNFTHVPFLHEGISLVIANSNIKRQLIESQYALRREECEQAAAIIRETRPLDNLGQLHANDFNKLIPLFSDHEILMKRLRHVVGEDMRVLTAAKAMHDNDMDRLGGLMLDSHISLRNDFEVSCEPLDALIEEAYNTHLTIGSRMTGAGFGGCTINLVKLGTEEEFVQKLGEQYKQRTGLIADFYLVKAGKGAGRI